MRSQRSMIPLIGMGATLLAHLLLLTPVFWGSGASQLPRPPDATGASANAGSAQDMSTESLVLIELNTVTQIPAAPTSMAQLPPLAAPPSLLQLLGPNSLPLVPILSDPDGEIAQSSAADVLARTRLAGIYESQIRDRIERAWRRPRTALVDDLFQCQIKVWQDAQGHVQRVALQECEGTPEWFDSIVNAVKAASPLPAPPNPKVFADSFQMRFTSVTYQPGADERGFETAE